MSANTSIEWAHHTFNPWSGCAKVSPGCANCYAANLPPSMRRGAEWGEGRPRVVASDAYWREPLAWARKAKAAGERHWVFCASTADVFEARDDLDPWRCRLFDLIRETPELDWLLLTKRPEQAVKWWPLYSARWPDNAWIGTSVENQAAADERIPHLLQIPARVRFLSMEPLLGPVDLGGYMGVLLPGHRWADCLCAQIDPVDRPCFRCGGGGGIHWVIVGGESGRGSGARPMHPAWARSLRDQCKAAGVPFFVLGRCS